MELFYPDRLKDTEFYIKLKDIMTHIMGEYYSDYNDILNKFRDFTNINDEGLKETLREHGFESILNVLDVDKEGLIKLNYFIGLIGLLRGTNDGVILVSKLLGGDSKITEWYQNGASVSTPYTFDLSWTVPAEFMSEETFDRFRLFLLSYVFPLLQEWLISSSIAFGFDGADPLVYGFSDFNEDKYWINNIPVSLGEYYTPTIPNGLLYECITPGTTGLIEPIWNINLNSIVVDGTVTWKTVKASETPGGCFSFIYN